MIPRSTTRLFLLAMMLAAASTLAVAAASPQQGQLSVAVTEPDILVIVNAVGGTQVETFSLFKGCILRDNLAVEPAAKGRLAKADVVVWSGFLKESAAINAGMSNAAPMSKEHAPAWIDVSKNAARSNVPTSTCFGYVDPQYASGDPFFWLNPENGAVIARNVAVGLSRVRPDKREYFMANAEAVKATLAKDIARWKGEIKSLGKLRVFSAQCGWQNFSKLGGPALVVCKGTPGTLPSPELLLERVKQMKPQIVLLDPNTPVEYGRVFREQSEYKVIEVASSIDDLPGAHTYSALFDNFVRTLQAAAKN